MIVADANLLAYLIVPGDRTEEAEGVLAADPIWAAPPLWRSELRSVLYKYVAPGLITSSRALELLEYAETILDGREAEISSKDVFELAARSKCSTYDCEYVALARSLNVPLITTDRVVLRAFPKIAVAPAAFLAG